MKVLNTKLLGSIAIVASVVGCGQAYKKNTKSDTKDQNQASICADLQLEGYWKVQLEKSASTDAPPAMIHSFEKKGAELLQTLPKVDPKIAKPYSIVLNTEVCEMSLVDPEKSSILQGLKVQEVKSNEKTKTVESFVAQICKVKEKVEDPNKNGICSDKLEEAKLTYVSITKEEAEKLIAEANAEIASETDPDANTETSTETSSETDNSANPKTPENSQTTTDGAAQPAATEFNSGKLADEQCVGLDLAGKVSSRNIYRTDKMTEVGKLTSTDSKTKWMVDQNKDKASLELQGCRLIQNNGGAAKPLCYDITCIEKSDSAETIIEAVLLDDCEKPTKGTLMMFRYGRDEK